MGTNARSRIQSDSAEYIFLQDRKSPTESKVSPPVLSCNGGGPGYTVRRMRPLVKASVATAVLSALAWWGDRGIPTRSLTRALKPSTESIESGLSTLCPPGTLPDHAGCVPLPAMAQETDSDRQKAPEHVGLLPDRTKALGAYELPVKAVDGTAVLTRGYEPQRPGTRQADCGNGQGPHLGLDLGTGPDAQVTSVALEGQDGQAEVVFVGELVGTTVVTMHRVKRQGQEVRVLVIYGQLGATEPSCVVGQSIATGSVVGRAKGEGASALHLETREVRASASQLELGSLKLLEGQVSIATDPRNVLAMKR